MHPFMKAHGLHMTKTPVSQSLSLCLSLFLSLRSSSDPARSPGAVCRVGSEEDGILGAEVSYTLRSVGSNTVLWPGLLQDGWLGRPDPINQLVVLCPNFAYEAAA